MGKLYLSFLSILIFLGQISLAAEIGRVSRRLRISDFNGKTFFEFMTDERGVKAALDQDEEDEFKLATKATVHQAVSSFDPAVYNKITNLFSDGEAGFDQLMESLANEDQLSPATMASKIGSVLQNENLLKDSNKIGLAAVTIAPFVAMVSGAGVPVQIDNANSYLNYGYKAGSEGPTQLEKDVKSGRSFGVSATRKALDPSDVYYLKELENYLGGDDVAPLYKAILDVLLQCNNSSYSSVSAGGQTIATDFFAIYTAELDRHLMTKLTKHFWENDLAEVTFLSAFGTKVGMVYKNGQLVEGSPVDYFGVGKTGSGIGETRKDRRALQLEVTNAERKLHPEIVARLEKLIDGQADGDVMRELMEYLNNFDTQNSVEQNSAEIEKAALDFLMQIRADADEISNQIK